jgi:hypothetical protein
VTAEPSRLGQVGGLDVYLGEQFADLAWAFTEQFEHPDTDRMTQHPEELGLLLIQRHRHVTN